jgi:hypothetical protein
MHGSLIVEHREIATAAAILKVGGKDRTGG